MPLSGNEGRFDAYISTDGHGETESVSWGDVSPIISKESFMNSRAVTTVFATTVALLSIPALVDAQARTFHVRDDGGSRVTFVSDAPLETMTGVSSRMTGELSIDPNNVSATRGTIRVPISSLRTGIDLRDEHLRNDKWLDEKRFSHATFAITSVSGPEKLQPNKDTKLKIQGDFTIHGVTRKVTATAKVRWVPLTEEMRKTPGITGDVVRGSASFSVRLTDYGITVPSIVRLKVANEIDVTVNLRAIAGK